MDDKDLLDEFFDEAAYYGRDFTESCKKILGKRKFEEVEKLRKKLNEFGSHITHPDEFEDLHGLYFCDKGDLRFETLTATDNAGILG